VTLQFVPPIAGEPAGVLHVARQALDLGVVARHVFGADGAADVFCRQAASPNLLKVNVSARLDGDRAVAVDVGQRTSPEIDRA
jgi:hypothetical protein